MLREVVRLEPGFAGAHLNLGAVLSNRLGRHAEAAAAFREALRLEPGNVMAQANLGVALEKSGDRAGAIEAYREALRLEPRMLRLHARIGGLLEQTARFREAAEAYRGDPASALHVARTERLAAAHERLPAILSGDARPAGAAERISLAEVCYWIDEHADAVRFYRDAFQEDPTLLADREHRYSAACSAARAGSDGHDQALAWLRAHLEFWRAKLESDPKTVASSMRWWKGDSDLASVRDADDLPEKWRRLWADVDKLLASAEAGD